MIGKVEKTYTITMTVEEMGILLGIFNQARCGIGVGIAQEQKDLMLPFYMLAEVNPDDL